MAENQPVSGQSKISRRCTVQEAASLLGVSVETVRGRIKRGILVAQRTDEGVFVWLQVVPDKDQTTTPHQPVEDQSSEHSELATPFTEQIAYLREQLDHDR